VDILEDNNHAKNKQELLDVMDKFELNSQFSGSTTKEKSQLDHIWINVFGNECKSGVIIAYWPYFHKPICVAFKLPNTLPMCKEKPLMFSFI
jgi:hypothetical protein